MSKIKENKRPKSKKADGKEKKAGIDVENIKKFMSDKYNTVVEFIHRPWFYNKKFLVALSVICSVTLWAVLAVNVSPVETRTISSVPITINTETIQENYGLDFVEVISPESVKDLKMDITVSGRKYLLTQLTADDFYAVATPNNSVSKPGSYDLTITVTCNNPLIDVTIESSTQQMYVSFDRFVSKDFTVSNVIGVGATVSEDSGLTMGTPYSNVSTVSIYGPETEVAEIDYVVVSADVNKELTEGETFSGELVFYNSNNEVLELSDNIEISTDASEDISVTIPVRTTREYEVTVSFKNTPDNFSSSTLPIEITPSTITLIGSPDAFDYTTDAIYTAGEIDLSSLSNTSNEFNFDVSLSTGLETADGVESINVKIDLSEYEVKTMSVSSDVAEFSIINYTGTRKVVFNTSSLSNVSIIGPSGVIDDISEEDIIVAADMTGMETVTGSCTVSAFVYVDGFSSSCWAIGTYEVEVNIGS